MRFRSKLADIAAVVMLATAPIGAHAGNLVEAPSWMVVQPVEVLGHSPHESVRLYEQGSIDALGFRPVGGDVYCFSIKLWMTDGRRIYLEDRSFDQGEVSEIELGGTNRTVDRVEFSCHPQFGVTALTLEILVR